MISLVISIAVVLLLSAFFTGVEAATLSITHPEVDLLKQQKRFGSDWLSKIHANIDHAIIAMVIMSNITSIVGSVVIGQIAINAFGSAALAIVTVILTLAMIVLAEIIPKTLGIHYNKSIALYCANIIYILILILYPIVVMLQWLTNYFKHGEKHIGTEEQIRSLVTMGRQAGHIETDEGHLIHRAFILNDKTAQDSMTPLKDIVFVRHSMTVA
jgi:putative hemolysin